MSQEGYLQIGADSPQIWCHHYFFADVSQKEAITEALAAAFGGDVHVHENTWSGLNGIITAMRLLMVFMYIVVAFFIFVVTIMTGTRLLVFEQRDIGIYKSMGFTDRVLRFSFATRFSLTAGIGSLIGSVLAAIFTDSLVAAVTLLFFFFAYVAAGKIKGIDMTLLISE